MSESRFKVNTIKIKLDDFGRGRAWITDKEGENEIEFAATMDWHIVAKAGALTVVVVKMMANVEFEGAAAITLDPETVVEPDIGELQQD